MTERLWKQQQWEKCTDDERDRGRHSTGMFPREEYRWKSGQKQAEVYNKSYEGGDLSFLLPKVMKQP